MRPRSIRWIVVAVVFAVTTLLAAQEALDLQGTWQLTVSFNLVDQPTGGEPVGGDCEYQGTASVNQNGMSFSGSADLDLVQGIAECPREMTAQLTGQATLMGQISGQLTSMDFGVTDFTGALVKASGTFAGTSMVTSSPMPALQGAVGNWIAAGQFQTVEIPTLSALGLALLLILLLGAGFLLLRRRPA